MVRSESSDDPLGGEPDGCRSIGRVDELFEAVASDGGHGNERTGRDRTEESGTRSERHRVIRAAVEWFCR